MQVYFYESSIRRNNNGRVTASPMYFLQNKVVQIKSCIDLFIIVNPDNMHIFVISGVQISNVLCIFYLNFEILLICMIFFFSQIGM